MSGMLGMDPYQAQDYSNKMSSSASEFRELINVISQMVGNVAWYGHNANQFKEDWNSSIMNEVHGVVEALESKASQLGNYALQQLHISGN
jgi:uncharacterized protein YukE